MEKLPEVFGNEPTLRTPSVAAPAGDGAETIPFLEGVTPPTSASRTEGKGSTWINRTGGLDDAWHLEGRKGPFTGQSWGDFDLGGVIGEGGMGAVYRARQKSLRRRVAVKVLPLAMTSNEELLRRFHLEATTTSKLSSPHIVQVYFIGEQEGNHYYAMEFVDGTDLSHQIKSRQAEGKAPDVDEAISLVLQAAKGLAEAGRQGVVHRDIKPANLMLTRDGLVKIADFGIVKVLGEHHLTMTGQAMGTPAYISPEQGRGDREVDGRSDLYSLGVVLYELACGSKPFDGASPNALIYQHCFEEPVLPRQANPSVSEEIQAVILRCLQKKPENRYQTADALVADLEAIRTGAMLKSALANYRLGTGADEARREQMNWFQRHLLPLSAVAALLVLVGGGISYWYVKRAQQAIQAERGVTDQRTLLAAALDRPMALPEDVERRLAEFASFAPDGRRDADYKRWSAKVARVRELQESLEVLKESVITVSARQAAKADLGEYIALVGIDETLASLGKERLAKLDAEEALLRGAGTKLDANAMKMGERDRLKQLSDALAALVPEDDADLVKWRKRIASFDSGLAEARKLIAPLDQEQTVTEAKRAQYAAALTGVGAYLEESDGDVLRWKARLEEAGTKVANLRESIRAIVGPAADMISQPKHDQIADNLASYRTLVGDDDVFARDWLAAISKARITETGCRQRLAEKAAQAQGLLTVGVQEQFGRDLAKLESLIYAGDAKVQEWKELLRSSIATIEDLRSSLKILEPSDPRPVPVAAQRELAQRMSRLLAKGGLAADRADAYRARLAAEQAQVETLRSAASAFDRSVPMTSALLDDLDRLAAYVGNDDPEVRRWQAKRTRVDALKQRIGAIDRKEPVPDDLDRLFVQLESLVGAQDPDLTRWRGKVARIDEARKALAVLDRREAYAAAEVEADLEVLAELIGRTDSSYLRWRAKADEVRRLKEALAALSSRMALGQADSIRAQIQLRRLSTELIGTGDGAVRAAAARLQQLSPATPPWALRGGRDARGPWAEAALPGATLRFRHVAPINGVIGSPDGEPGREADELQVTVRLPLGFWIAETECPQALWKAVMGQDPSRGRGDPLRQPVDRVSWDDCQVFLAALRSAMPGFPVRLPWEAEWELACRAGDIRPWNLPDGVATDDEGVGKVAWMASNAGGDPHESGGRLPNAIGLYDMHGNVAEWMADSYQPYPTGGGVVTAPWAGGGRRVLRGASWGDAWLKTRAANRIPADADLRSVYAGLRLAVDAQPVSEGDDGAALLARLAGVTEVNLSLGSWTVNLVRKRDPASHLP